jgi:Tfp pilus assembly protein PilN
MSQARIDFAPPGLARTVFHTSPQAWLLGVCALVLWLAAALIGWRLVEQQRADDAELAARLRARAPVAVTPVAPAPVVSPARAAAVNRVVLQLNLPWRALHDAIAGATPKHIALLALEPDARKHSIKLTAEAQSGEQMIAYIEQLKQQPLFDDVLLRRHEINEQDKNRPLRFQLDAHWSAP